MVAIECPDKQEFLYALTTGDLILAYQKRLRSVQCEEYAVTEEHAITENI